MRAAPNGVVSKVFEILVENKDGDFITYDVRHTKEQADDVAALLRRTKKKVTKVVDRDYKRPPREERGRGRGRRDDYEEE
jgi:hypothetical protein